MKVIFIKSKQNNVLYQCCFQSEYHKECQQEIERQRINDRIGFQSRFQIAGNLIFKPQIRYTLHIEDKQRFNNEHHVNDQIKREKDREKQDRFYQARLNKRIERKQNRWELYEKNDKHDEKKNITFTKKCKLKQQKFQQDIILLHYNMIQLSQDKHLGNMIKSNK